MLEFEVFYHTPKGKSMGMVCRGEQALISFVSRLRTPARIMFKGQHIGRVWKDDNRWQWFYDPEIRSNNASTQTATTCALGCYFNQNGECLLTECVE